MVWPFRTRERTSGISSMVRSSANTSPFAQLAHNDLVEFWKNGNLPSNSMLLGWLQRVSKNPALQPHDHYAPGTKRFLYDLQDALLVTEQLISSKNSDELLQTLCYHISLATRLAFADISHDRRIWLGGDSNNNWFLGTGHEEEEWKTASEMARKELEMAFAICRFLLVSGDFGGVFQELTALTRKIAESLANHFPSKSPALKKEFLSPGKQFVAAEVPVEIPIFPKRQPIEKTRSEPYFTDPDREFAIKEQFTEARSTLESLKNDIQPSQEPLRMQDGASLYEQSEMFAKSPILPSFRDVASPANMPPLSDLPIFYGKSEAVSRSGEIQETEPLMFNYDWIEQQLREIFDKIKSDRSLLESVHEFIRISGRIFNLFNSKPTSTIDGSVVPEEVRRDANFHSIFTDLKMLLKRFSDEKSIEALLAISRKFIEKVESDPQLKIYVHNWGEFCKRAVKGDTFSASNEFSGALQSLLKNGDELLFQTPKYTALLHELIDYWSSFAESFSKDGIAVEFGLKWSKVLMKDLLADVSRWTLSSFLGAMSPTITADLRHYILPELMQQFHSMTIPELVCENKNYTLFIRNIRVTPETLLPAECDITLDNRIRIRPRDRLFSRSRATPTEH